MTTTLAYQLSETTTDLKFEIFLNQNDEGFYKILEGSASKAESRKGNLKWYAQALGNELVAIYSWEDKADGSFNMTFEGLDYLLTFDIAADGAGTIQQSFDGDLYVRYTWNAAGTGGTVTYFDSEGNITDSSDWTI